MNSEGFRITGGRGFHITFPNGYTVSVQFGPANYCSNYMLRIGHDDIKAGEQGSINAETAYWAADGSFIKELGDEVQAYQSVDQVMQRLIRVYNLPKQEA